MSEEQIAALDETVELEVNNDQVDEQQAEESNSESAPEQKPEEKQEDGFQKRINKVTADKYAEKRRADELQRQLNELNSKPVVEAAKKPTLEDYDHDDEAYNAANIEYQVGKAVQKETDKLQQNAANAKQAVIQSDFNDRITAINKADFDEVANAVPQLPPGVADALMQSENGPELIYHLGTHLDQADKLAGMTPTAAIMELGKLSVSMNAAPTKKTSAAPEPIQTLNSGGAISQERGPTGATFE